MHFQHFEEMAVWQDARRLTQAIYRATGTLAYRRDFGLRDQIQRAAVSIIENISEGYTRASRKEFLLDLNYAKGQNRIQTHR